MNRKQIVLVASTCFAIAVGAVAGYKLSTDRDLRENLHRKAKHAFASSRQRMDDMSEEVALRTAKVTKNPRINQEWVKHQWDAIEV